MKTCTRCGAAKKLSRFYVVNGRPESRCKDCENARRRHREHLARSGVSDITPEQELAMRRRARKCPMPGCGVRLTDEPGKPNSKHLDHIIPVNPTIGGTHTHGNVRIICADCNLKRPKDGSDYSGPVTLWAQGEIIVSRPDRRHDRSATWTTCRSGLHPWTSGNIKVTNGGKKLCKLCYAAKSQAKWKKHHPRRTCKCGALFAAPGKTLMCPDCVLIAVRTAATLRFADCLSWNEIAAQVGYASGTGIRDAVVRRTGPSPWILHPATLQPEPPKAASGRPPGRRCACGEPLSRGRITCEGCVEKRAWRAVEMRKGGMTLREIADALGCNSITTVTNLMKTVVPIESRMGRPRSS